MPLIYANPISSFSIHLALGKEQTLMCYYLKLHLNPSIWINEKNLYFNISKNPNHKVHNIEVTTFVGYQDSIRGEI